MNRQSAKRYIPKDPRSSFVIENEKEIKYLRYFIYLGPSILVVLMEASSSHDPQAGVGQGLAVIYAFFFGIILTVVEIVIKSKHIVGYLHWFTFPFCIAIALLIGISARA